MKKIYSIKEIINNYDNFIIDQWGVMHDGSMAINMQLKQLNYLNRKNKNLFIISNSSKREKSSIEDFQAYGYKKELFHKSFN